jgi:pimeloyl-ACP methyl ester carboxylesterase
MRHGNPATHAQFLGLVPLLGTGPLVAMNHPGFGGSDDFADGHHSLERSAETAISLLDALGLEAPVDVVGHSHGGLMAVALAALAPHRVGRVLAIASGGTPAHGSYRLLATPLVEPALASSSHRIFRNALSARVARAAIVFGTRQSALPDVLPLAVAEEEVERFRRRPSSLVTMARLATDDPCRKCAQLAPLVRARTWFVHGRDDRLVPAAFARRLQGLVPGSRFVEVEGGHLVHLLHPERLRETIATWRSRT